MPYSFAFDLSHDEMIDPAEDYITYIGLLKSENVTVHILNEFKDDEINKHDVIAILTPQTPFNQPELDLLLNWVKKGGGLLLMGEWGGIGENTEILNNIARYFGVEFQPDRVCDTQNVVSKKTIGKYTLEIKKPFNVMITTFRKEHPIFQGVSAIGYYSGCSIKGDEANIIAWGSENSFSDLDFDSTRQEWEGEGYIPVVAAISYQNGRVVCIGDNDSIGNERINDLDNQRFAINVVRWLTKQI